MFTTQMSNLNERTKQAMKDKLSSQFYGLPNVDYLRTVYRAERIRDHAELPDVVDLKRAEHSIDTLLEGDVTKGPP